MSYFFQAMNSRNGIKVLINYLSGISTLTFAGTTLALVVAIASAAVVIAGDVCLGLYADPSDEQDCRLFSEGVRDWLLVAFLLESWE